MAYYWGKWQGRHLSEAWREHIRNDPIISHFLRLKTLVASGIFWILFFAVEKEYLARRDSSQKLHGCRCPAGHALKYYKRACVPRKQPFPPKFLTQLYRHTHANFKAAIQNS